ncbi:hypothetical protein HMPREF9578_01444 [Cutibacterium acnes HL110PA4]|nr:hypothetical protein HMPREF9577_00961 [Cutibacterium acnes HL110PA3]EFT64569.1 hypothetical protein HMPREF9578_01444 [Cutibacterium acnes HL110PA4]EFT76556.1 hypothetical protein HMPREF9599_02123 [Cutibacterium acnes HL050PA2]
MGGVLIDRRCRPLLTMASRQTESCTKVTLLASSILAILMKLKRPQ